MHVVKLISKGGGAFRSRIRREAPRANYMKNPVSVLLVFFTLMVSAMAVYINMRNMLYGDPLSLLNVAASGIYLLAWVMLTVYSLRHHGICSFLLNVYWFSALLGAALCMITISGMTRILEYAAYIMLLLLTPLFGIRVFPISHFMWSFVMVCIALCFCIAAIAASNRRVSVHCADGAKTGAPDIEEGMPAYTVAAEDAAVGSARPVAEDTSAEMARPTAKETTAGSARPAAKDAAGETALPAVEDATTVPSSSAAEDSAVEEEGTE